MSLTANLAYTSSMKLRTHVWSALAACLLLSPLHAATDPAPAHIPELHGKSLAGSEVNLPDGLRGKVGVLILGFSQSSRDEVTVWGRRLSADYRDSTSVSFYELPMLASVPRLLRGFVLDKIASSVSDPAKPHFVAVTDHEADWKAAAGFKSNDDAYVLLVDGSGTIRWRYAGAATDAVYAQVKQRVEALRTGK